MPWVEDTGTAPAAPAPPTPGRWVEDDAHSAADSGVEWVPSPDGKRLIPRINITAQDVAPSQDTVNKVATPLIRGIGDIVGLPGSAGEVAPGLRGGDFNPAKMFGGTPAGLALTLMRNMPTAKDVQESLFDVTGIPETNAESHVGRIAQGAGEGLTAALAGGGLSLPAIMSGVLSGGAHQTAKELFPDSRVFPFFAALLGGGLPSAVKYLRPTSTEIIQQSLPTLPRAKLDNASEVQQLANQQRNPVTGPEATGLPDLLRLQRIIEQSPQGAPLRQIVEARPQAQAGAAQRVVNDLGGPVPPAEAADAAKAAAGKSIKELTDARTAAVNPAYEAAKANTIAEENIAPLLQKIDEHIVAVGTESKIGKELLAFKAKVQSTVQPGTLGNEAVVGPLDAIYKETRDAVGKSKFEPGALDNEVKGILKPLAKQLGDILATHNIHIASGRATYRAMTPAVNEAKASPVGKLAKVPEPTLGKTASITLDPANVRPEQVTKTFMALARQGAESTAKFLAAFVDSTMDTALKRLANGKVENAGGKFYTSIAGTPYAEANLRAAFNTLPNGGTKWQAFKNTLRVFEAQSQRHPVGTDTADKLAASQKLSGGISPRFLKWFDDMRAELVSGRNRAQLAELFARSDSVDEMTRIANLRPGARESAARIGQFLAVETQALPSAGDRSR